MKIAWMADIHYKDTWADSAKQTVKNAINYLMNTKECDVLVLGGDNCHPTTGTQPPQQTESCINEFFAMLNELNVLEVTYAIPGNHDVPLDWWYIKAMEYIGSRAICPQRVVFPDCDIFLVNTVGSRGFGDIGASGQSNPRAVTVNRGYIPYNEVKYLTSLLANSKNNSKPRLVFCHYLLGKVASINYFGSGDGIHEDHIYHMTLNYQVTKDMWDSYTPIVYLQGHWFQFTQEAYLNTDEHYYVVKKHYCKPSTAEFYTIAYVEVNGNNVKVVTVENDLQTENTIMDVTPSW